jgi:hypothetical protein
MEQFSLYSILPDAYLCKQMVFLQCACDITIRKDVKEIELFLRFQAYNY